MIEQKIDRVRPRAADEKKAWRFGEDYMTVSEFCKHFGLAPFSITVYRMIAQGKINAQKIGYEWRIPRTELKRLYDEAENERLKKAALNVQRIKAWRKTADKR